jgi:hypothetical protein
MPQQYIISTLTGKSIVVTVEPSTDTVLDVLFQISDKEGIPANQMRLIHQGRVMGPEDSLFKNNIKNDGAIHLVLSLRKQEQP